MDVRVSTRASVYVLEETSEKAKAELLVELKRHLDRALGDWSRSQTAIGLRTPTVGFQIERVERVA